MDIQSSHRRNICWSHMPENVLCLIAHFVTDAEDVQSFRAVCKNWHCASTTLTSTFLPRHIASDVSLKLISSSILLIRPLNAPHVPPFMVRTIDSTKDKIQFFDPFSRILLDLPQDFDFTQFQFSKLTPACHVLTNDDLGDPGFSSNCGPYAKLLVNRQTLRFIDRCSLFALSDEGIVRQFWPYKVDNYLKLLISDFKEVNDVVEYKGRTYALDIRGRLCSLCTITPTYCRARPLRLCASISRGRGKKGRRKRLVVSPSGELYLIVPVNLQDRVPSHAIRLQLLVYKLKEFTDENEWVWREVDYFGGSGQVLFVSRDHCFFVAAADFPKSNLENCILFSDDAFPICYNHSWNYEDKFGDQILIYRLDGNHHYSQEFWTEEFWSPPQWVFSNASSPLQSPSHSQSQSESKQDDMKQSNSNSEDCASSQEKVSHASSVPECEEQTPEIPSGDAAQGITTNLHSTNDNEMISNNKDSASSREDLENLEDHNAQTQAHPMDQPSGHQISTFKKFQGVNVKSDHLHVLQNVWMKHGDIIKGSAIHGRDTKAMAWASLAKMVLILQTNNGNTLTDDQASYLGSTLSDLQFMHLKVDWLAPLVEEALVIHKTKQLKVSLMELEKAKAKAEDMERKFLLEMAKTKQKLDRDIIFVSESIPISSPIDLNKCLGEGLC